jgi:hypothetical protein
MVKKELASNIEKNSQEKNNLETDEELNKLVKRTFCK